MASSATPRAGTWSPPFLIAMVAMLFTAVSYGRMARIYPVRVQPTPMLAMRFIRWRATLSGWSMLMDYMLNPIICAIWCSAAAQNVLPPDPLRRVGARLCRRLHRAESCRCAGLQPRERGARPGHGIVVVVFLAFAIRYIAMAVRPAGYAWLIPFYDPARFNGRTPAARTSIAVLTYIGFDGISTMSEEVENPRRNIMLATVFTVSRHRALLSGC